MAKSIHNKNTWEEVRKIRAEFTKDNVNDYPYYSGLNEVWDVLCHTIYAGQPYGKTEPIVDRASDEKLAKSPLEAFRYYMDVGIYPPPELLVWLSDAFNHYFMSNGDGEVPLDEVFFGKPKPKVGNGAKQEQKDSYFSSFAMQVSMENMSAKHQNRKPISLEKLATLHFKNKGILIGLIESEDINENEIPDIDNFLRGYRRWKTSDK